MFENITYEPKTGRFYNKKGKEIGWKNSRGYVYITTKKGKAERAHRLAWYKVYGYFPTKEIDHINGIRDDNRIENLREVTRLENMHNLECHRKGSVPGIKKRWNKYALYVCGKYKGLYKTQQEAEAAYLKLASTSV